MTAPHLRKQLVVVGHGMVGHRFVQAAIERGLTETHDVVVVGEECRPAYDRVALTRTSRSAPTRCRCCPRARTTTRGSGCCSAPRSSASTPGPRPCCSTTAASLAFDELVLATGAAPFVPPVPGHDLPGSFVYRTIEDLEAIREAAAAAPVGAVVGGGLLGLEAAKALADLGLETHVVEMAPRLMAVQVDDAGGATLRRHVEGLGLHVHTGAMTTEVLGDTRVTGLGSEGRGADRRPSSSSSPPASARATRWPARPVSTSPSAAASWSTSSAGRRDPQVWAIGECAAPGGRMYGLVAPGYAMAEVAVDALLGGEGAFTGADMSTKLKLMGVDVAIVRRRVRDDRGCARARLLRRRRRRLQEAGRQRRRHPAPRWGAGRRRVGVRRAAADGRVGHRAARPTRRS